MSEKTLISKKCYNELIKRKQELLKEEAENGEAIDAARRQGDLSENADYDAARKKQAEINSEKIKLNNVLENYELIEDVDKTGRINLGKTITVKYLGDEFKDEEDFSVKIYGTYEADIFENVISNECPLGKALINAKIGDEVSFRLDSGDIFYVRVLNIK